VSAVAGAPAAQRRSAVAAVAASVGIAPVSRRRAARQLALLARAELDAAKITDVLRRIPASPEGRGERQSLPLLAHCDSECGDLQSARLVSMKVGGLSTGCRGGSPGMCACVTGGWRTVTRRAARRVERRQALDRPADVGQGGRAVGGWRAALISLWPPRREDQATWEGLAPVAHVQKGRQAARRRVAPAGAKGWLRDSMCQTASVSRRATSIWATLAPRCLPSRRSVAW
jgi:hypothetical protein